MRLARCEIGLSPPGKIFLLTVTSFCLVFVLPLCAPVYLWSSAEKGLTSWLSFVVSNCEFVTFPLVSLVRCGT